MAMTFKTHLYPNEDGKFQMGSAEKGWLFYGKLYGTFYGDVYGNLYGNADTATSAMTASIATKADYAVSATTATTASKLSNFLSISLNGNEAVSWNGSEDSAIDITLASLGGATANHTHDYLPLSGGTLTGALTAPTINISSTLTLGSQLTANTSSVTIKNLIVSTNLDIVNKSKIVTYNTSRVGCFWVGS